VHGVVTVRFTPPVGFPGGGHEVILVGKSSGQLDAAGVTVLAPLKITSASLPAGVVSKPYSSTLAVTGGVAPYTWSLASGKVPPGLTLSKAGVVSGAPGKAGSVTFTVRVANSSKLVASVSKVFTVSVAAVGVKTTTLSAGTVTEPYKATLAAYGGTKPLAWTVSSGKLPAGLTLSKAGVIAGTPSKAGSVRFTVKVTDAGKHTATKSLTVAVAAVGVKTTTLPAGTVTKPYKATLTAYGGAKPLAWTVSSGKLPAGLTLSKAGVIAGTPSKAGSVTFTVKVTDAGKHTATKSLTVTVAAVGVKTTTLPGGTKAKSYKTTLSAYGGTKPLAWTLSSGKLPAGLTLSKAGVIAGTPSKAGSVTFTVKVTDAGKHIATKSLSITIKS
jgi:hypothetical protein